MQLPRHAGPLHGIPSVIAALSRATRGACRAAQHDGLSGPGARQFTGENCATPFNPCKANEDSCDDAHSECISTGPGRHRCACDPGWTGKNCDAEADLCETTPCQNGGGCVDLYDAFECTCRSGYGGDTCELDVNECASRPCYRRGSTACHEGVDAYTCDCEPGWTGHHCDETVDQCTPNPCRNGGVCDDSRTQAYITAGFYHCTCNPGQVSTVLSGYNSGEVQ